MGLRGLVSHLVDVHVVDIAAEHFLGFLGGFGSAVCLDFVGFDFVVKILYIHLINAVGVAVGATGRAIVAVFDGREERSLI